MDYYSGGSLSAVIKSLWNDKKLIKLSKQVLKGLCLLHADGIIHRDIKPDNILYNSNGDAVITDFGISASLKKRHTVKNFRDHVKNVWLTGVYSPPEQGDFTKAFKVMGPTNDIFAFGVVLFELISGGEFPHGSLQDFVNDMESYENNKRAGVWRKELIRGSSVSNEWVSIIDKCLKGNPLLRYMSVDELLKDIRYRIGSIDDRYVHNINIKVKKQEVKEGESWIFKMMNGDSIGQEFNLTNIVKYRNKQLLTIGWYDESNPNVNDLGFKEIYTQYISERHATIEVEQIGKKQKWFIRDGQFYKRNDVVGFYNSKNGIIVNGIKIDRPTQLKNNDILIFGDTSIKVIAD